MDATLIHLQADWNAVRALVGEHLRAVGMDYERGRPLDANIFKLRAVYPERFFELATAVAALESVNIDRAPVHQAVIDELKGATWALFTANSRATARAALATQGLRHLSPKMVVTREDVLRPKPDPEGALLILKKMNWPACETEFLGDSDNDMNAARDAGVKFRRVGEFG